jgi:hypothetical protein
MENYICINGKKAELTEEQLKALGIELPKRNLFERVVSNNVNDFYSYYFITSMGTVNEAVDHGFDNGNGNDELRYRAANYCTDHDLIQQRAYNETLSRLLWRYSMEHDGDKIDWRIGIRQRKYKIIRSFDANKFDVTWVYNCENIFTPYFISQGVAEAAIKEIIKPFMETHPDFKF